MAMNPDLSGLLQFFKQDEWPDHFEEVFGRHLGRVLDEAGIDIDDLDSLAGPETKMALWGCAFEDFLTQTFGSDQHNLVDTYLAKRAWKESPATKAYLKALCTSVMSLYEVTDIVHGKSFEARDLLRGGNTVRVYEGTASRTLAEGDIIACRVVTVLGQVGISGGLLGFSDGDRQPLLELLQQAVGHSAPPPWSDLSRDVLSRMAPLISNAWLLSQVARTLADRADEGDDAPLFHEIEFPLAPGVKQKPVQAALSAVPDLVRRRHNTWAWIDGAAQGADPVWTPEHGWLVLKGGKLTLSVESEALADMGVAMLKAALGDLVGVPEITVESIDDILADPAFAGLFAEGDDLGAAADEDPSDDPLGRAQEMIYDAWDAPSKKQRLALARKALEISPLCADGWVILAEAEQNDGQRAEYYRKGVEAGEKAIGPRDFEDYKGNFWGFLETRPYMRARAGLAQALWSLGRQDEAIAHLNDMLALNPGDNQGMRYVLSDYLLARDDRKALKLLFKRYDDDDSAAWLYSRSLLAFRDKAPAAATLARDAFEANHYVPALLAGLKKPVRTGGYVTMGGADEAASYVEHNRQPWHDTPGAIAWLCEVTAVKAANARS